MMQVERKEEEVPSNGWKSFMSQVSSITSAGSRPADDSNLPVSNELSRVESALSIRTAPSCVTQDSRLPNEKPKRLVDFFCVVGAEPPRKPGKSSADSNDEASKAPSEVKSCVLDCYPSYRNDMEFPHHIHTFCFPNGYQVSTLPKAPTLMTLVLTSSSGHRLYGAVLTMYDDMVSQAVVSDGSGESPPPKKKAKQETQFHPKCLVVVSHHAYFHVFRKFLQQLHRIYQSGTSPLPLERYIANFVNDVPLPPLRSRVQWNCFTTNDASRVALEQPAPNQLPLVNFSYQPLFRTLSVANVLVVWGTLLQEGRVVLCSEHHALLTPVAEALRSLLFPLEWQGMYIPVLPSNMQDVMDAPVPYLVGTDSKYLLEQSRPRPNGVVVVDLDDDVVHLGWDDNWKPRRMPALPDQVTLALSIELEERAELLYLVSPSGIRGLVTNGNGETVDNSMRGVYSQMTRLRPRNHRQFIMSNAERAFVDEKKLDVLTGDDFALEAPEQLTRQLSTRKQAETPTATPRKSGKAIVTALRRSTRSAQARADRLLAFAGQTFATPVMGEDNQELEKKKFKIATRFYEIDDPGRMNDNNDSDKKFSTDSIRQAFLRCLASILLNYKKYVKTDASGQVSFLKENFVNQLRISQQSKDYMAEVVSSQMFERFIHDASIATPQRCQHVVVFDEHVIKKKNQSMWNNVAKQTTPFLESTRWKIQQVVTPVPPSTQGIRGGRVYQYKQFPSLVEKEFLHSSSPKPLYSSMMCEGALCSAFLCWPST